MKYIELMKEYVKLLESGDKEPWKHFEKRNVNSTNPKWFPVYKYDSFTDGMFNFRLKKQHIEINGFKVPEPVRTVLEYGTEYFYPSNTSETLIYITNWHNSWRDNWLLERGQIHLSKSAAILHSRALLSFTGLK